MIELPTHPLAHYAGDLLAWTCASAAAWWQHRRWPAQAQSLARRTEPGYFVALALGALAGAWIVGTLALAPRGFVPSHSIAGALAGAIAGVELWKWRHGVTGSTGGAFVLPICTGIAVGRLGCLFSGLPDMTFGTATALPWGVDLGDGVPRHPVQLYEGLTMGLFAMAYLRARNRNAHWAQAHAFHAMVIVYAAQRFVWEFLKPYPPLAGPFNFFHLLCGGLIAYGVIWWRRDHAREGAD
jgi:hypothetical protein